MIRKIFRRISLRESLSWQFPFRFPWDMRRSQGFRQFTDCMVPDHSIRIIFHVTTVYFWCGCSSGCAGRICHRRTWNRKWHKRSHGGSSGADFFCSIVAAGVLFYEGRKTGQFYLRTGYGGIYHRNLHDDHTDAGAKTDGRNGRSRGTF